MKENILKEHGHEKSEGGLQSDTERNFNSTRDNPYTGIRSQVLEIFNIIVSSFENFKRKIPQVVYSEVNQKKGLNASGEDGSKDNYQLFVLPPFSYKSGSANISLSKLKPSPFPESLMTQALARFSPLKDSIEIVYTTISQKSPTGRLPFILTPEGKALVGEGLRNLLLFGKNLPDNDENTSLEVRAMLHLIESTLETTLLYFFFMDPEYFNRKTLPYLSTGLSWPVNWISAQIIKQQTITSLLKRHPILDKDLLLLDSSGTLKALELTLRSNQKVSQTDLSDSNYSNDIVYFSTTGKPGLLDAAVFAHFHIMSTAFSSKHPLKELSDEFPLLQEHSNKIASEFFPKSSKK